MTLFMIVLGIVAVAGLLVGLLAMLKAAEMEQALKKMKKQQEDETDALRQRVEALSKAINSKENPFAASKASPPVEKKAVSPPRPPTASPQPPPAAPVVIDEPEKDVNFDCPHCGQNIDAPASMAGFHVNCPTCSGLITIPETSHATPPAQRASMAGGQEAGQAAQESSEEEVLKGATVRIDIGKMFDELDNRPKRQIVIKRRR